jgi:dipeptidyl aminopeptidase/acylaminoacyl peptidase
MKTYTFLCLALCNLSFVISAFAESSAASLAAETPVVVAPTAVKQLPAEAFGSLPDVTNMRISPDGKRLASIIRVDLNNVKGSAVQIVNLETGEKKISLFSDNKTYTLYWLNWKSNEFLLVGSMYPEARSVGQSARRYKTRETRMLILDIVNDKITSPFSTQYLAKQQISPLYQDNVIDFLEDDKDNILMSVSGAYNEQGGLTPNVYKVNLRNQKMELIQRAMDYTYSWITDQQHRVRISATYKDTSTTILTRDIDSEKWRELWKYDAFSDDEVNPLGFGLDPNILYVSAYLNNFKAIFKVNLKDPELKKELIFSEPMGDVAGGLIYSSDHDVIGIAYDNGAKYIYFDAKNKKFQAGVDKALPLTANYILGMSADNQKYIVFSSSSTESGAYYFGDRKKGTLDPIAYSYKVLTPELMANRKEYLYKARDGLEIVGYLTVPKNSAGKNLPTVIFPHGGPISYDAKGFDYWAQFFANRGYAVLQMNFRGSSGKGLAFRNAGLKNWGQEMQDDVEDGARKMIADGITDAKRICIVGASYGGYAALMGAVKTPDFYKCAASIAGVSNVYELVRDHRYGGKKSVVDLQIGDDDKLLKEYSPVYHAEKIKIPVLLVHGDMDRQVEPKHSENMNEALKKAGKNVTYISLPNEDHFLTNNENRVATFKALDDFLAKALK